MTREGKIAAFLAGWSSLLTVAWFTAAGYFIVTGLWIAGLAMILAFAFGLGSLLWAALSS